MPDLSESIGKSLKLYALSAKGYCNSADIVKFRNFLKDSLEKYIFAPDSQLPEEKIIERLQILEESARRLAIAFFSYKSLFDKKRIPDSEITSDDIIDYQQKKILTLQYHIKHILEIVDENRLPFPINHINNDKNVMRKCNNPACGSFMKYVEPSLNKELKSFSEFLQKYIKLESADSDKKKADKKRGKGPLRAAVIYALTDAWIDITNKAPERLKRDTYSDEVDNSYGEFKKYVEAGIKLFEGKKINVSEAIKEAYPHFLKRLVVKAEISILSKANKSANKIKNDLNYDEFRKAILAAIEENNLFKQLRPNQKKKDICTINCLIEEEWKNLVSISGD